MPFWLELFNPAGRNQCPFGGSELISRLMVLGVGFLLAWGIIKVLQPQDVDHRTDSGLSPEDMQWLLVRPTAR